MLETFAESPLAARLALGAALVLGGGALAMIVLWRGAVLAERRAAFTGYLDSARKGGTDLALIFEHVEWTASAKWGLALLVLWNFSTFAAYASQQFASHQMVLLLGWIGGNQIAGLMILVSRRRVLIVRKAPPEK